MKADKIGMRVACERKCVLLVPVVVISMYHAVLAPNRIIHKTKNNVRRERERGRPQKIIGLSR